MDFLGRLFLGFSAALLLAIACAGSAYSAREQDGQGKPVPTAPCPRPPSDTTTTLGPAVPTTLPTPCPNIVVGASGACLINDGNIALDPATGRLFCWARLGTKMNAKLRDPGELGPWSLPGSTCPYAGCDSWPEGEKLLPRNSKPARMAMECLYGGRSLRLSGSRIDCTRTPEPMKNLMALKPAPACITDARASGCDPHFMDGERVH